MSQSRFFRGFAPVGSVVVVGWLALVGFALAQDDHWQTWSNHPLHPKWGWFGQAANPISGNAAAPEWNGQMAQQAHPDPTSAAHPDWDSLPTEQTWTAPTPMDESAKSLEPATKELATPTDNTPATAENVSEIPEINEKSSVCLSENGNAAEDQQETNATVLEGEVQSMEEYFQRYGTYAGSSGSPTLITLPDSWPSETYPRKLGAGDFAEQVETMAEDMQQPRQQQQPEETQSGGDASTQEHQNSSGLQSDTPPAEEAVDPIAEQSSEADMQANEQAEDLEAQAQGEEQADEEEQANEAFEQLESSEPGQELQTTQSPGENTQSAQQPMTETQQEILSQEPGIKPSANMPEQSPQTEAQPEEATPPRHPSESQPEHPLPADQLEPGISDEAQKLEEAPLQQEPSPEVSPAWEYEPGYGRVEAQYTPATESTPSSQPAADAPARLESNLSPGLPSEGQTTLPETQAEGLPEEEYFTPPPEFLPQERYEYPQQDWQQEDKDPELIPEQLPSAENTDGNATLINNQPCQEPSIQQGQSLDPTQPENKPQQSTQTETFWADMPGPVSQTPVSEAPVQQPQENTYEWWLENPDHWTEETSQPVARPAMQELDAGLQKSSGTQQTPGENPMGDEESAGPEGASSSEPNMSSGGLQKPTAGDKPPADQVNPPLLPEAGEGARYTYPTLLEGIGRSLRRLVEPWGRKFSNLWNISIPADWWTGSFSSAEENLQ
ncbi:MAG: hypothetical protein NZ602_13880, partial [Thermoguttaceae bacterium]|nr:hypothetical protein [Thermoguttaceae bacterium]MDW8038753.1 hypothetical protein [Thermoguttaceae bacterium]